uniref:Argonaute 4 n=1 Tax=Ginkgo biloba TaxID=3311 RepID=A0A0C4W2P3_GINBI|nr:Argonaute 4 [Ginkgo biloba]
MDSKEVPGSCDEAGPSSIKEEPVNLPPPPPLPASGILPQQLQLEAVNVPPPGILPQQLQPEAVNMPPPAPQLEKNEAQRPETPRLTPMRRPGLGRCGRPVQLLCNHFRVTFTNIQDSFHYNVTITAEGRPPVTNKVLCRKIMDKVKEIYGQSELDNKEFAYDGEKSMFTIGPLTRNNVECFVVLEDDKGSSSRVAGSGSPSEIEKKKKRKEDRGQKFKVEIAFAAKVSMKSLHSVLQGEVSDKAQDALRVLDIVLRQHASRKGYLLVRQSFFHWGFAPLVEIGGGVTGCRGYHISFRPTQKGLSLNMDVSTTMLIKQGMVIEFLLANQNVRDPHRIDWLKAKRVLKGIRVRTVHTNMEFKILGFSEQICRNQLFPLKTRNGDSEPKVVEVTVLDYFINQRRTPLKFSADLPCVDVGRAKRPNYLPIELCEILPGQRYTKSLTTPQRTALVEQSRQRPEERMQVLQKAMDVNDYNSDPLLRACNINVDKRLVALDGRILEPPKLKFGLVEESPRNGRWNFNNKTMIRAAEIKSWAVANFNPRCHPNEAKFIAHELQQCCSKRGMVMSTCGGVLEEPPNGRNLNPIDRVERMLEQMKAKLPNPPEFLLCILPERKTSDLYGPWKRKFLSDWGIVNQCISPIKKVNDQYLTNVALKINAKVGGLNSVLTVEATNRIPKISAQPTIIIGMDVSHGSPGHADSPSIAAVVASREWPLISRYRASVRTQSPKVEMIEALYKPSPTGADSGMINELLIDFYKTCKSPPNVARKPMQMIIFRDGVSESQFDQVLNIELQSILKACDHIESGYRPKVTLIVAQKNHHTKLFQNVNGNVQPGTIVDANICHPRNYDFYLCPQAGPIGTSRPTHYHVLLDENNFTVDDLQILVHALSYVYQRSTTAISSVAPINYAHLAATQMQQFLKAEDLSEAASRSGRGEGSVASGVGAVPELPQLHKKVCDTMFFC